MKKIHVIVGSAIVLLIIVLLFRLGDWNKVIDLFTLIMGVVSLIIGGISVFIAYKAHKKIDEQIRTSLKSRDIDLIFKLLEKGRLSDISQYLFNSKMLEKHISLRKKVLVAKNDFLDGFFINDYYIDTKKGYVYYNKANYLLHNECHKLYSVVDDFRLIESVIAYTPYKDKIKQFLQIALEKDDKKQQLISKKVNYKGLNEKFEKCCNQTKEIEDIYGQYYHTQAGLANLVVKLDIVCMKFAAAGQLTTKIKESYDELNLYGNIMSVYQEANLDNWIGDIANEKAY